MESVGSEARVLPIPPDHASMLAEVIRKTNRPGTDHGQTVYELRCGDCRRSHGANGSDIFQRRCPHCDRKSTGEDLLA